MAYDLIASFYSEHTSPLAVILGVNEVASAVAFELRRAGFAVVMSHDPFPPVIRRKMSFHDALYDESASLDGVFAENADAVLDLIRIFARGRIAVTRLPLNELLTMRRIDVLVDGRLQKHRITPDFRGVAKLTIGLGPHFAVKVNCDAAIETHPAHSGAIVQNGATISADSVIPHLGGFSDERFIYSSREGIWRCPLEIGTRIYKGLALGRLSEETIFAPMDGVLRGLARDGAHIPKGVKLLEIDPRGRKAQWMGVDPRCASIGKAVLRAIQILNASLLSVMMH